MTRQQFFYLHRRHALTPAQAALIAALMWEDDQ
jgi:hypothetical protein